MNSPLSELRTTSTPRPSVAASTPSAKSSERESNTCSTPSPARIARLAGLPAVAYTSAPSASSELHRGHPDAAGGGVDEDSVAGVQPAESTERVLGGEERDRDGGRVLEAEVVGNADGQIGVGREVAGERPRAHRHHPVTGAQVLDAGADTHDLAAALVAERTDAARDTDRARSARRGSSAP